MDFHENRQKIKGWICLDIDGTLTDDKLTLPKPVENYLEELSNAHWRIVFVTGRLFSFGYAPLKNLNFPYYFVPQNGASWYEMPSETMKGKKYLPLETFLELEPLLKGSSLDFLLVSGYEYGELCYYRPDHLTKDIAAYFRETLSTLGGQWEAVTSFNQLQVEEFPYAKIYGPQDQLHDFLPIFKRIPSIKTHLVQDSVNPKNFILQIMRRDVDKGKAILDIIHNHVLPSPIIGAGNDYNDETLLEVSDIKIAMPSSPKSLLELADIVAPPVSENGIIPALKMAIKQAELI